MATIGAEKADLAAASAGCCAAHRPRNSASSCRPSTSRPIFRSWSSGSAAYSPRCDWEVIFVDDNSPDGTAAVARAIGAGDYRVRCIRRIGRRGLAGACLEGMLASQARYVAVMDADLQHDETRLAADARCVARQPTPSIVIDQPLCRRRQLEAGLMIPLRAKVSRWSNRVTQLPCSAIELTDPMSGFFMIRRDAFEPLAPSLSSQGFKILLDCLATARGKPAHARIAFGVSTSASTATSKLDSKSRARLCRTGGSEAHQRRPSRPASCCSAWSA